MTEPIANNARGKSKNTVFGLYKIIFFRELIFQIVDNFSVNLPSARQAQCGLTAN
jgi:hypothetical protein